MMNIAKIILTPLVRGLTPAERNHAQFPEHSHSPRCTRTHMHMQAGFVGTYPVHTLQSIQRPCPPCPPPPSPPQALSVGFECLAEDAAAVLALFAEVVTQPAVPPPTVELYKSQVLNVLEHRNDNPSAVPARELAKLVYGSGSVFAREAEPAAVAGISAADVAAFLATWERPDAAVLAVVGERGEGGGGGGGCGAWLLALAAGGAERLRAAKVGALRGLLVQSGQRLNLVPPCCVRSSCCCRRL